MEDRDTSPGLGGLLAVMGRPRGGEAAPAVPPDDDVVVPGSEDTVPEREVVAAAEVRAAIRAGTDEDFAKALARFVRVLRLDD